MNFYFCEACGKRVTEIDIATGAAQNKEAKGVYCKSCSVGVKTTSLAPAAGPEPAEVPKAVIATSVSKKIPAPKSSEEKVAVQSTPRPAKPAVAMVWFVIAGVVFLIVVAALVLSRSDTENTEAAKPPPLPPPSRKADEHTSKVEVPAATRALKNNALPPPALEAGEMLPDHKPPAKSGTDKGAEPAEKVPSEKKPPPELDPGIEKTPLPVPAPTPAPSERPKDEPPTPTPTEVPAKPPAALMTYQKLEDLVLGTGKLVEIQNSATQALETIEPADKATGTLLIEALTQATGADAAVRAALLSKKGSRIILTRPDGSRRFVDVTVDPDGGVNIHPEDLALSQFQEFARDQLKAGKETDARIASYQALRGDPELARKLVAQLDPPLRTTLEHIVNARGKTVREARAVEELKKFNELLEKNNLSGALTLGNQIVKEYAGCKALAELDPPLETRLAEIQSGSVELRNIFMCDAKRLPDGRIELNFDLKNPQHLLEFVDRGLPGWFTEIEADISLENDGRWIRIIRLGDSAVIHYQTAAQGIEHLGKTYKQEHSEPNPNKNDYYGAHGGVHRYRIKAGPQGISLQVDEEAVQMAPGPWRGGRLKWGGHNVPLPTALKVIGKFDPLWMTEMAAVAKDRAKFLTGAVVDLKPRPRAQPRPETEPFMMCWGQGEDKEVRGIAAWNEIGASWTVEGQEFISPRPKDRKMGWTSIFWPSALISPCAELAFDAKLEAGQVTVLLPTPTLWGQGGTRSGTYTTVTLSNDGAKVNDCGMFGHAPNERGEGAVRAEVKFATGKSGQWCNYKVLCTKAVLAVFVDGKQVLEYKRANGGLPMAFWASPGEEYHLKNITIRKVE